MHETQAAIARNFPMLESPSLIIDRDKGVLYCRWKYKGQDYDTFADGHTDYERAQNLATELQQWCSRIKRRVYASQLHGIAR